MALTAADLAGIALIAVATLAGAWLGRRFAALRTMSLTCAGAALAAVVAADLVPDVWGDLRETGLPWWIAAAGLAAGLAGTDALVRRGCACGPCGPAAGLGPSGPAAALGPSGPAAALRPSGPAAGLRPSGPAAGLGPSRPAAGLGPGTKVPASGLAAAVALVVHRALEGAALAVAGSAAVIAALVAHAGSEGFALTTLLAGERRGRAAWLLAITCLSPACGVALLAWVHLPARAVPVLTSAVAGVLLRAAIAAWQLAGVRAWRLPAWVRKRTNGHTI
jgi:ZIP family zinc transporter